MIRMKMIMKSRITTNSVTYNVIINDINNNNTYDNNDEYNNTYDDNDEYNNTYDNIIMMNIIILMIT